jgi:hypothetical protein
MMIKKEGLQNRLPRWNLGNSTVVGYCDPAPTSAPAILEVVNMYMGK